ncbi:MAG: RNA polymerase sigma factor [Candidatus Cryptobacteroides sp.]
MLDKEKELLMKLAEGDETAFHRLFEYYYPRVKVFLSRMIECDEDVKDLTQNIFIRIWMLRAMLPEINLFGAYLYRMSRNAAIDYCKSRGVRVSLPDEFEGYAEESSDEKYVARETELRISREVSMLPRKRRQIFIMSRVEGLPNAEIARRLDISVKTVENQITLALKQLRGVVSVIALIMGI